MVELKNELDKYSQIKQRTMFINKWNFDQNRQLKNGWWNGIIGVDTIDDKNTKLYGEKWALLQAKKAKAEYKK